MKSDYEKLCQRYDALTKENEKLQKEIETYKRQNVMFLKAKKENDFLKKEIFEIKLLLSKKVNKYMEVLLNARK